MSAAAGANEGAAFIAAQGPVRNLCGTIIHNHVINNKFYETQESLGCGRHALNNLLGGKYFKKEGDYNPNELPISLQGLCRTMGAILTSRGVEGTHCPDNEFYDVTVLTAALNILGFKVSQNIPREKVESRDDTYGFIVNKQVGAHWVALRKEGDKYRFIDSMDKAAHAPGILKLSGALMTLEEFKKANPNYIAFINVRKPAKRVCINPLAYLDQRNTSDCPPVDTILTIGEIEFTVINTEINSNTKKCSWIYVISNREDPRYSLLSQKSPIFNIYFILTDRIKVYSPDLVPYDKNVVVESLYNKISITAPSQLIKDLEKRELAMARYERSIIIKNCVRAIIDNTAMPADANKISQVTISIHTLDSKLYKDPSEFTLIQRGVETEEVQLVESLIHRPAAARAAPAAANAARVANAAAANAAAAARVANAANAAAAIAVANAANVAEAIAAANAARVAAASASNATAIAAARARNNAGVNAASRRNNKAVRAAAEIAASAAPASVYLAKEPPPGYKSVLAVAGIINLPPGWTLKQINNPEAPQRHGRFYFKHETTGVKAWTLNLPISGGRRRKTRRRQTRK